jgi:hypothetical protein
MAPRQTDCSACSAAHEVSDDELGAYIQELAARAPPLSSEQRDKLALLLNTSRRAA